MDLATSHSKGIGTATLHKIYMDCASGKAVPAWKVDDLMSYHDFCPIEQMMSYDPKDGHYPGDSSFRSATHLPIKHHAKRCNIYDKSSAEDYIEAQHNRRCCSNSYKINQRCIERDGSTLQLSLCNMGRCQILSRQQGSLHSSPLNTLKLFCCHLAVPVANKSLVAARLCTQYDIG
eukprot:10837699-Ditylum_brightwellii.AAC.1